MSFLEQRKSTRFNGEILLELKQGKGLTRNFSADGIYFATDQTLYVDEQIDFVMILEHSGAGKLRCRGKVLRVEAGSEMSGVAVAITAQRLEVMCRNG